MKRSIHIYTPTAKSTGAFYMVRATISCERGHVVSDTPLAHVNAFTLTAQCVACEAIKKEDK